VKSEVLRTCPKAEEWVRLTSKRGGYAGAELRVHASSTQAALTSDMRAAYSTRNYNTSSEIEVDPCACLNSTNAIFTSASIAPPISKTNHRYNTASHHQYLRLITGTIQHSWSFIPCELQRQDPEELCRIKPSMDATTVAFAFAFS